MSKIVIVAETGADIPKHIVDKYNIRIVPMHVIMDGECLDDGNFPVEQIFEYYDKNKKLPTTSATNPEEFKRMFELIKKENRDCEILHLSYSAVTTSTFQNAKIGSDDLNFVTHIDTKCVSGGQGALVLKVAEHLKKFPNIKMTELAEITQQWIKRARMVFVPSTLEYLHAGGRVSDVAYIGGTLLNLKPVISVEDGYLICIKKHRGSMKSVCKKVIQEMLDKYNLEKESLYLLYSERLSEEIKIEAMQFIEKLGFMNVTFVKTGGTISTHCGPGAFGIGGFVLE